MAALPGSRRGSRWKGLVLLGCLAWYVWPGTVEAAHWPEHNCLADAAANGAAGVEYPDEFWQAAQELAGHKVARAKPRLLIADWPEGHGVYGGGTLGGCFDEKEWAIQITPHLRTSNAAYEISFIHELTHAVLDDKGMPAVEHHCWMQDQQYHSRIARWLYSHQHRTDLAIIGTAVLYEDMLLDQCRALGQR